MYLRRFLFLLFACCALGLPLVAQNNPQSIAAANACAKFDVTGLSTLGIQVTGTWTATLQPEVAIAGQSAVNTQVTPSTSSTAQSTISANGIYYANVAGASTFLLCASAYTSGTASVWFQGSSKVNASLFGGGGGGGVPTGVTNGSALVSSGVSRSPVYQAKPVIDARDIAGVDCTGATTSDAALNALTGNAPTSNDAITGKTLSFARCPFIKLSNTWLIKNQASFVIDCGTRSGAAGAAPVFQWTGAAGTPEIDMEYTDGFEWRGCSIDSGRGSHGATIGINVDKTGSGGTWNTTDGRFINMTFNTGTVSGDNNWVGVQLSAVSGSNVEDMRVEDSTVYCAGTNSTGILVGASANAKNEIFKHNNFTTCYYGIWLKNGSMQVLDSEFSANGGTCGSGTGADIRLDNWTDGIRIVGNLDEGGVQFINQNNDGVGFGGVQPVLVEANHIAPSGCQNTSKYSINTGQQATAWSIVGNEWDPQSPWLNVIGTAGNAQSIIETHANVWPNSAFVKWWLQSGYVVSSDIPAALSGPSITTGASSLISSFFINNGAYSGPSPQQVFSTKMWDGSAPQLDQWQFGTVGSTTNSGNYGVAYVSNYVPSSATPGTINTAFALAQPFSGLTTVAVGSTVIDGVQTIGTAGSTSNTYKIVSRAMGGTSAASAASTITTSNATLSGGNCNRVLWRPPTPSANTGAAGIWGYDIYRTAAGGTPSTTGKLATVSALAGSNGNGYVYTDCGVAGDSGTAPSTNNSGLITLGGNLLFTSDNSNDIGAAAATRPRRVYAGTDFVGPIGATTPNTGAFTTLSATTVSATGYVASGAGAGNLNLGQGANLQPQANAVQLEAGTSEPAAGYNVIFPATGAAGVLQSTYGTGAVGTVACSSCGALTTGNVSVSAGGTYAVSPACWVTGGGGTGATCSAGALSGGSVITANVTITNGGSGYTSAATLNFSNDVELSIGAGLNYVAPTLTVSSAGNGNGVLALSGNTSGTATFTAPAVAGTRTNGVSMSNVLLAPNGANGTPAYGATNGGSPSGTGMYFVSLGGSLASVIGGVSGTDLPSVQFFTGPSTGNSAAWSILGTGSTYTTQSLYPNNDATSDIGLNATTDRPRNLYLSGLLNVANGAVVANSSGNVTATGAVTESLGGKFTCTHGSNATCGVSTLSSGTVTVSTTAIAALAAAGAAGDVISLTLENCSTCGTLSVGTVSAGTSFVINSTNGADASNVYWEIRHIN